MTNGEKLRATFPNMRITLMESYVQVMGENYEFNNAYPYTWWNAEYKEPTTKNDIGVDCISRAEVIEEINSVANDAWDEEQMRVDLIAEINALSSVTPIRPKGHWINIDATHSRCNRCGALFEIASANGEVNYCPNCGADMREVKE